MSKGTHADAAPGCQVGNLNMNVDEDTRLVRRMAARYPLDEKIRGQMIEALKIALQLSLAHKNVRKINSTIRTLAAIDKLNQTDELAEKGLPPGGTVINVLMTDDQVSRANEICIRYGLPDMTSPGGLLGPRETCEPKEN